VLAAAASTALKAAGAGLSFGPSRAVLSQLLPAAGQGPGEKTRRTGYFRIQIHTRTSAGARYLGTVEAQGDPGYAATSVMLGETALCLALDKDQLPDRAGVLTPATAMGAALAARLRSAGHTLATRQITQLPRQAPASWPLSLALHAACSPNEIKKALTEPVTRPDSHRNGDQAAPGRRHVRALRPNRLRSQKLPGPDGPRRRSPAILVAGEGFLNWRP
jgi:hypothetical protein